MRAYLLLLFVSLTLFGFAQEKNFERGKRLYDQYKYSEAIPYLEKSYKSENNMEALPYLAYSFLKIKDYNSALLYFRQLAFDRKADPVYYLEYGKLLKNQGFYLDAKPWFIQYLRSNQGNMEVRQLLRSCDVTPELMNNPLGFGVSAWKHNSEAMEFCPTPYKNGWVFASNRNKALDGNPYGWDNLPYLKLMFVSDSSEPESFSYRLMDKYHSGPACFSPDGNRIYFTRNNQENGRVIKDEKGVARLVIVYSDLVDGKWSKPKQLNFSSKEYSIGHPCLNADGTILYFTSDMPGGQGGTDIWMARKISEFEWGIPENLGVKINTPGEESFPNLLRDTLLTFSSDYHPGLGGLDLFFSILKKGEWSTPTNFGFPINSYHDDFGMVYNKDGMSGFIASNRIGGKGFDDIYTFKKIKVCVNVTVMDSNTYDLLPKAVVRITNGYQFTEELMTGADGKISLCLPIDNNFKITTERKGYLPKRYTFSSKGLLSDKDTQLLAELIPGEMSSFSGLVYDDETNQLLPGALITVTGPGGYKEITSSNDVGYFDLAVDPGVTYDLVASKDGYLVHKEKIALTDESNRVKIYLNKGEVNAKITIENIYYDLNSAEIRPDARLILDTLVNIMRNNPYLQVELGSHTDSRASDDYNQKLSLQRAQSVIAYMSSKGIDPYRFTYHYYGETQLLRPCPDGVECDETDHQMNRRTEFKIIAY
ncbi:MAG: OmpA family protein [Bacteroidota bacterium]|nr:OmpA family protein [Bacteroidota bacterium]MDX5431861.1 OmpA family protein [Bacteroidota bacterium]MDX5470572.1 OmpA family protein [Bacteroidota bacterium]